MKRFHTTLALGLLALANGGTGRAEEAGAGTKPEIRVETKAKTRTATRAGKVFPRVPRQPSVVTIERSGTDKMLLRWSGGNPPWSVQRTFSLADGAWETIAGPLSVEFCFVPVESPAAFYRVIVAAPDSRRSPAPAP